MNARIAERLALENSLRHGLERGEFVVYYQPQVDISSGQIVGMEALVRWQHPERGLISPAEFIPVAEETGLIVPLGAWVLRTACAQNTAWQEAGVTHMRMAVNLSARQFQLRDLIDTVAQVLEETRLDPQFLQLEITEGVAMQDVEFTVMMLRELREMGVQIAMDDFGTGHSSLSYLKRFPINILKIDQSFVRDLTVDPDDAAIASTIIMMAHNLKLKVIAEGVETEDQLAFLRERQCDEMQGYLFSKPAPAEAFEAMLRQGGGRSRARRPVRANR
jgi:EAL domain-containing protein (putative c-di-GMP-specific phosphodiesterase class I)